MKKILILLLLASGFAQANNYLGVFGTRVDDLVVSNPGNIAAVAAGAGWACYVDASSFPGVGVGYTTPDSCVTFVAPTTPPVPPASTVGGDTVIWASNAQASIGGPPTNTFGAGPSLFGLVYDTSGGIGSYLINSFGSNPMVIDFQASGGTPGHPTAINNSPLGLIAFDGYGTTGYSLGNNTIQVEPSDNPWTDTAQGSKMAFNIVQQGTIVSTQTLLLDTDLSVYAGPFPNGIGGSPNFLHAYGGIDLMNTVDQSVVSISAPTGMTGFGRWIWAKNDAVGALNSDGSGNLSFLPSARGASLSFSTGALTGITANEIVGYGKVAQTLTVDSISAAAAGFTCTITNPTFTVLDCGTSAGVCTSGTTSIGTVTVTGTGGFAGSVSGATSIPIGHFWAVELTAGSCTLLNATGSISVH